MNNGNTLVTSMSSRALTRRSVMVSAAAALMVAANGRAAWAAANAIVSTDPVVSTDLVQAASAQPRLFDIVWGDDVFGTHLVTFETAGDVLRVHSTIDISFKFLWINALDYHHESVETWQDGRLQSFTSETSDKGRHETVRGEARGDGFEVTGRKGTVLAPADIMAGTFWNPAIVSRDVVFDPQKGTLEEQIVHGQDRLRIDVGGQPLDVTRYRLSSVLKGEVYYDDQGRWAGGKFKKKGQTIHYRLRA